MEQKNDFKQFYDSHLLPQLEILEQERKKFTPKLIAVIALIIVLAAVATILLIPILPPAAFIAAIAIIVAGVFIVGSLTKKYQASFKQNIITKMAKFIDESLVYQPKKFISKELYLSSEIFKQRTDRYYGEDHVSGKIGKTTIEFSELHTKYRTKDSKGRSHYHTIFKGVFFVADFNKHFKTETIVLPDIAQKLFGRFGQTLQATFGRKKLIKLEDPVFEKEFVVYADDQVEARYILSPALMERIINFKNKTKSRIFLSFVKSKIFVAVTLHKNLFEPRIFRSIIDYDFIKMNMDYLTLFTGIVDDLNLNNRIWTKQ